MRVEYGVVVVVLLEVAAMVEVFFAVEAVVTGGVPVLLPPTPLDDMLPTPTQ